MTLFGVRRVAWCLARNSAFGPAIGVWPGDRRLARRSAFGPVIGVWPGDRRLASRSAFGPAIGLAIGVWPGDLALATWRSARIPVGVSCRPKGYLDLIGGDLINIGGRVPRRSSGQTPTAGPNAGRRLPGQTPVANCRAKRRD